MHLAELNNMTALPSGAAAPEWMRGLFRRRSISFANGQTDTDTRVFWLQSRRLTIDLRLPTPAQQTAAADDIAQQADYEGWYACSVWDGEQLSWNGGDSYQLHNRWPEPALLSRTGNCMMEFAPSGAYVEDWRLQNDQPGPLIGLELVSEKDLSSGTEYERHGALIICGNYAGLVIGRQKKISTVQQQILREQLLNPELSEEKRSQLLDFETSLASGSLSSGFTVTDSLWHTRVGQPLLSPEGFEPDSERGYLRQLLMIDGKKIARRYRIDTFDMAFPFTAQTSTTVEAAQWLQQESRTLTRYTRSVS